MDEGKRPNSMKPNNWLKIQGGNRYFEGNFGTESSCSPPSDIDVFQDEEEGAGSRVGSEYQAEIPNIIPVADRNAEEDADPALLIWRPTKKLTESQLEDFIWMARTGHNYTIDQALGFLHWHRCNIKKASKDLVGYGPADEAWKIEDKILFEQSYQFYGKCFDKIQKMLPDKSMSTIMTYYYNWKKRENARSGMERSVKKLKLEAEDEETRGGGTTNGPGKLKLTPPKTCKGKNVPKNLQRQNIQNQAKPKIKVIMILK